MRLSVIVVSWNVAKLLDRCLESLKQDLAGTGIQTEVFVIDNDSKDGSVEMVGANHPWAYLIANNENFGFAKANNQALKLAKGDYILFLNPDTEIIPGAIKELLGFLDRYPQAGVVAPQLINSDGSIQRSCRAFPTFLAMLYELLGLSKLFPDNQTFGSYKMLDFDHNECRQVDQPEGACLLSRKEVFQKVGNLDEGFFMLFEEVDWCYRVKQAGWQIWFYPQAKVIHHYGQSIKQVKTRMILSSHRGLYRFWSKHYQKGRWYMSAPVYGGLMLLAYLRILSYHLKSRLKNRSLASIEARGR